MAPSKRAQEEFSEEVQVSHSGRHKLQRGEVELKRMQEMLKGREEHARIFASYQEAISELREFYAREASFEQMLQRTVDSFVSSFGYYMAWYGELKSDEKVVLPKVWAGKYERYLDGLRIELDDSKDAKCAMSLAIVRKEPFGYADLEHDKDFEKWRPLALEYGYRSNQAIPLIIDGKSVGAFLVYSTRPRAFSGDLVGYLVGIANELATIVENITNRRKAGEVYRTLIDHSLQGLAIIQDERVVFANRAIGEITGYTVDEMLAASSQEVQAFIHPADRTLVWDWHRARLKGEQSADHYELRGIRKDGAICWLEIHASPIEYRDRPAVQAACIDVTERKETEQALHKRTEELTAMNEMAMELAVASSRADVYRLVCETLKSITGALFTGITSYDSRRHELKVEHVSADSTFISKASSILGQKVDELRIPLERSYTEQMLSEKARRLEGLYELMFGTIPEGVAGALRDALGIGDVYGLALHYGGKIMGTMPILMPQQGRLLSIEMLKAFANLVTTSLQRMKAEEERLTAMQERAVVIDTMSDALVVLNLSGEITSCNPAHLKMFGHSSASEIVGKRFGELREAFADPEQDIPRLLGVFEGIIRDSVSEPIEVKVRRTDGKELTVSASASLQRDAMGNPLSVVAILKDITLQKRLQEVEREATATRMAVEMIEGMLEVVAIVDLDGTIRHVNSEFEVRSGYRREEVVGKTAVEVGIISRQEDQRIEKEVIPRLMDEGFVRNIETSATSRDGTRFTALMSWRLMKDTRGDPKAILVSATDITELKQAEAQLREYQRQLLSLTLELSLTEERERRHIAAVLHDRITQLLVFAKMKLDDVLSLSAKSVDLGGALKEISSMLDRTIEETQTLTYDLGSPTLYELGLEAAIDEWLTEEIEEKHNISTSLETEGVPESLSQDLTGLLFRSVRELLVNAVKHSRAHNVKVTLQGEEERIRICVEDDGVGFELSESGVPRDKKGRYGLFSIKQRLSHIGGHMEIRSQPDHGTRVVLVVPSKTIRWEETRSR